MLTLYTAPASEPPNYSGIYAIRCLANSKVYVGSAVWIAKRWRHHREALRKNEHYNRRLQAAWNKYGSGTFEFSVLTQTSRDKLLSEEQRFIDSFGACGGSGFNLNPIAGSGLGRVYPPEVRARMSKAKRGKKLTLSAERMRELTETMLGNTYMLGKKHTEETRAKLRAVRVGRKPSSGYVPTKENREMVGNRFRGKPLSVEHRAKISTALRGKEKSVEHRAHLSSVQRVFSAEQVQSIRDMLAEHRTMKAIASQFGCSAQTVCNIKQGRTAVYR